MKLGLPWKFLLVTFLVVVTVLALTFWPPPARVVTRVVVTVRVTFGPPAGLAAAAFRFLFCDEKSVA